MILLADILGSEPIENPASLIVMLFLFAILAVLGILRLTRGSRRNGSDSDPWNSDTSNDSLTGVGTSTSINVEDEEDEDEEDGEEEWSEEDEAFLRRSIGFLVEKGAVLDLDLVDEDESEVHRITENLTICVLLYDEYVFVVIEQDGTLYIAETNIVAY